MRMKSANCKSGDRCHISVRSQFLGYKDEADRRQLFPTAVSFHRAIPAARSPVVFRHFSDGRLGQGDRQMIVNSSLFDHL